MDLNLIKQYELIAQEDIGDIKATGYLLRHKNTGARVIYLENDDVNKVFYIGFRTPPTDSTGVPHIIEHSVLCGSDKYPAKDPFVELAKGSLNTFLNAMTYPDKTVYPVASCNDKDFKNLMDVYLDAVFHPNIYSKPQIFKQEGWHYELSGKDEDVTLNGVVYSEMKGAFSSPDGVLDRCILNSLFPDNCYGVESGGDPDVIPSLKYEDFLDFHGRYYHPSNSYIYLYGDMDICERLEYIDREYLSKYSSLEIDSKVQKQKAFEDTYCVTMDYPVSNSEPTQDNTFISYNAVLEDSLDKELYIAFDIIDYALIGAPGAVLKQAYLDSGICKDVDSTYENGIRQPYYSIILRNSNESSKDEFLKITRQVLEGIVKNGFDKNALLAEINVSEFKFREADFGRYPKGLMYGLQILDTWLYDDEKPFTLLKALDTYKFLRENVDTGYFEGLVEKYLLNNSHSSVVTLVPKKGLTAQKDKELADRLKAYKMSLSEEEIGKLIEDTQKLHEYQETADDEETLAKLPMLEISDIKRQTDEIIYTKHENEDYDLITHDIFTNGIGYVKFGFDITDLPQEWISYMGLLLDVLGFVNTANYNYTDLNNDILINTGGMCIAPNLVPMTDPGMGYRYYVEFRAKIFYDKLDYAAGMMKEILYTSDFTDKKRLYEIICMAKSHIASAMLSAGHIIARSRAGANVTPQGLIAEKTAGISFYRFIEEIENDFDNKWQEVIDKLKTLSGMIFNKGTFAYADYTAEKKEDDNFKKTAREFYSSLPEQTVKLTGFDFKPAVKREAFKTGAKIQYVAAVGNYFDGQIEYNGALRVLKTIMGYDYLWNQVRVVGGAYGAFATFLRSGEGSFVSYRDPNLTRTLDIYEKADDYLKNFSASSKDMTKYIIGTISEMDIPETPSQKGSNGLTAYLSHNTAEKKQKVRNEVLDADKDTIRSLSIYAQNAMKNASICVIGGESIIEESADIFESIEPLFKS